MRKICRICDKFFLSDNNSICDECNEKKNICKEYIRTHKDTSMAEINLATGVKLRVIKKLIDEHYLEFK